MKYRVIMGIEVDSADRTNAELEAQKIIKKAKIEANIFSVEEA